MNAHTAKALLLDAWYQVLDNKVFRLLIIIVLGLVGLTLLVQFREEEVVLLFGYESISYDALSRNLIGGPAPEVANIHERVIQELQKLLATGLAGTLGVMICLAATAFFVPRMLEKGSADTLFSKPVGRTTLLVARYLSGVLFVALLTCLLVFGLHFSFLITSGYSDPGFLWTALTLVYLFALVHGVSVCVAAFTRSSVAAILFTLFFFVFNGCIHNGWIMLEHMQAQQAAIAAHADPDAPDDPFSQLREEESPHPFMRGFKASVYGAHYVLPKTTDAAILTAKLRKSLAEAPPVVRDEERSLTVGRNPEGYASPTVGDLLGDGVVWEAVDGEGRMVLTARDRVPEDSTEGGDLESRRSRRKVSSNQAANELVDELADAGRSPEKTRSDVQPLWPFVVSWSEPDSDLRREALFFNNGDWLFRLDVSYDPSGVPSEVHERRMDEFLERVEVIQSSAMSADPGQWYEQVFGWGAPWRWNAFFSIASSLAFVLAMLGLSAWRIGRIDF